MRWRGNKWFLILASCKDDQAPPIRLLNTAKTLTETQSGTSAAKNTNWVCDKKQRQWCGRVPCIELWEEFHKTDFQQGCVEYKLKQLSCERVRNRVILHETLVLSTTMTQRSREVTNNITKNWAPRAIAKGMSQALCDTIKVLLYLTFHRSIRWWHVQAERVRVHLMTNVLHTISNIL